MTRISAGFDNTDDAGVVTTSDGSGGEQKTQTYKGQWQLMMPVPVLGSDVEFSPVRNVSTPALVQGGEVVVRYPWPDGFLGGVPEAVLKVDFDTATTGTATLAVSIGKTADGDDTEADVYDTANTTTVDAPATAKRQAEAVIALSNRNNVAAGDTVYIKLGLTTWAGAGRVRLISWRIRAV